MTMMAMDPSIAAGAGASPAELHPFRPLRSSPALPPHFGRIRAVAQLASGHQQAPEKSDGDFFAAEYSQNATFEPLFYPNVVEMQMRGQYGDVNNPISEGNNGNHHGKSSLISAETCCSMLHECIENQDLINGRGVHLLLISHGLDLVSSVVNDLIHLYEACGSLAEADLAFSKVFCPSLSTWHALMLAYIDNGRNQRALEIYTRMEEQGITPNSFLFTCALKCCASIKAVLRGQLIHEDVIGLGLISDVFVASSLINFYLKTGYILKAWIIFKGLPCKNVVTWSTMIEGCVESKDMGLAIRLFEEMHCQGIEPNEATYLSIFNACGVVGDLSKGMFLHGQVIELGFEMTTGIANSLIDMYGKCQSMDEAREVFEDMPNTDVVSWNALIAGYILNEQITPACLVFETMLMKKMKPNRITYSSILKAYASMGSLREGKVIHDQVIKDGLELDEYVQSTLIDMYCKCSCLGEAHKVFENWHGCENIVVWGAMMAGYAQHNYGHTVLELFTKMKMVGMKPNSYVFSSVLKACSSIGALEEGWNIHQEIRLSGIGICAFLGSSLVDMYAKCGDLEAALRAFEGITSKDAVTWGAMIAGYVQHGHFVSALQLYDRMQREGPDPDQAVFISLLSACGGISILWQGQCLHREVISKGLCFGTEIGNAFLDMYTKCEGFKEAQTVFDAMQSRNETSWSIMIAMHAQRADFVSSRLYLKGMEEEDLAPDGILFTCILASCNRTGQLEEGLAFFRCMRDLYCIKPGIEHFGCMVELLGQGGQLEEAEELLEILPMLPDSTAWMSLLAACQKYKNVIVGRKCFSQVIRLDPKAAVAYVLMSNIYADAGLLQDAHAIDEERKRLNVWKVPGRAWIEIDKTVHEFVVGDKTHPESEGIYANLRRLSLCLKQEGYVPQLSALELEKAPEKSKESKEEALLVHCEKLAIAFGLLSTAEGVTLRVSKNLRVCQDCHNATKILSRIEKREIIIKDSHQVHRFHNGICSCELGTESCALHVSAESKIG